MKIEKKTLNEALEDGDFSNIEYILRRNYKELQKCRFFLEISFIPTEYVDITDVYEKKIQMLLCHESQEKWLREHDNVDYTNECRIMSEFRGMQCKVKYAEAFAPCLVSHRMTTKRVLP